MENPWMDSKYGLGNLGPEKRPKPRMNVSDISPEKKALLEDFLSGYITQEEFSEALKELKE